jgi:hypothetical protein
VRRAGVPTRKQRACPTENLRGWGGLTNLLTSYLPGLLLMVGCMSLPRDPEHTLERVQRERRVRVGVVEHPRG